MATAATPAPDAKRLELSVSNFGPIAEGRVELRPFTVFVGPSNTGKSYLATLIYALHSVFDGYGQNYHHRRGRSLGTLRAFPSVPPSQAMSKSTIEYLYDWASETRLRLEATGQQNSALCQLPDAIASLVRSVIIDNAAYYSTAFYNEAVRCFGVDGTKNLIRLPDGDQSTFSLRYYTTNVEKPHIRAEYDISVSEQGIDLNIMIPDETILRINPDVLTSGGWLAQSQYEHSEKDNFAHMSLAIIASHATDDIVGPLSHISHYLLTSRANLMHTHPTIVQSLIAGASQPAMAPTFSGILGDFLERIVSLGEQRNQREAADYPLALEMERDILGGAIRIASNPVGYPEFLYRPDGWERDLPLANASAMVSELAPVVLYLRHVVQPGDTLIIEEPESHLHPTMQVELTRLLARAVQAGVRIIITTHSEWVLEELANLVRLSELPPERRNGIEDPDVALGHDEVGAWFFERNDEAGGSVVREIRLDVDSGTFPSGFGLVTQDLYNRWVEIASRVENGE